MWRLLGARRGDDVEETSRVLGARREETSRVLDARREETLWTLGARRGDAVDPRRASRPPRLRYLKDKKSKKKHGKPRPEADADDAPRPAPKIKFGERMDAPPRFSSKPRPPKVR